MGYRNLNEYVHNAARTLAGQMRIRSQDWADHGNWPAKSRKVAAGEASPEYALSPPRLRITLAMTLYHRYEAQITDHVKTLDVAVRGLLASSDADMASRSAEGKQTQLFEVANGTLNTGLGGARIVTELAVLALVAALTDNIVADLRRWGSWKGL